MNQKIESPADLHADHRNWQSKISMWQFDIQEWRSEHAAALKQIERIKELIRLHEKTLEDHEDSVTAEEASLEYHEKNLAASLQGGSASDLDDALMSRHQEESDKHSRLRDAHERIKKHHHIAMAHVAALKNTLENAM